MCSYFVYSPPFSFKNKNLKNLLVDFLLASWDCGGGQMNLHDSDVCHAPMLFYNTNQDSLSVFFHFQNLPLRWKRHHFSPHSLTKVSPMAKHEVIWWEGLLSSFRGENSKGVVAVDLLNNNIIFHVWYLQQVSCVTW